MNVILAQNLLHDLGNIAEDIRDNPNESYKPYWQRIPDYKDDNVNNDFSNIAKIKYAINKDFTYNGYVGIINKRTHYALFQSILLKVLNSFLEPFNVITTRIYDLDVFVDFKNKESMLKAADSINDSTIQIPIDIDLEKKKMKLIIGGKRWYSDQIEYKPIKEDEGDGK